MSSTITTEKFVISYPNLFEARAIGLGSDKSFSLTMVFDDDADLSKLKQLANEAILKTFPNFASMGPQDDKFYGLRKPTAREIHANPFYEGKMLGFAKSKESWPPKIVKIVGKNPDGTAKCAPITKENRNEIYPGAICAAVVTAYAYNNAGNKGFRFGVRAVCKVADGDPLVGGHSNPEDDFASYATTTDTTDTQALLEGLLL